MTLQKEEQNKTIYKELTGIIPSRVLARKNKAKSWEYGYDKEHDIVVISKDGTLGTVCEIQGLRIGLPETPEEVYARSSKKKDQYWEPFEYPEQLKKIENTYHWREQSKEFKSRWIDYIDQEFDRREYGFWFMNNGRKVYITGSHYMYLQWSKIDVGLPDYREANRVFFIFWEACKADPRSYGMIYLKIRRSGFSYMESSECINIGTLAENSKVGILSKTGQDAKSMFIQKVVRINTGLPFFFKPIMDGMDRPKSELSYQVPASRITRKNMRDVGKEHEEGLNTTIDWRNTEDNSYDGEKLRFLAHDESGKWLKPNNIEKNYRVTKTCLRLGARIVGKVMMGSTCNSLEKGGEGFKNLYYKSNVDKRNKNGQTESGMYALFIPMEWNMEGFIDKYGYPVFRTPEEPVMGIDGQLIHTGAIDYWEAEVESLKDSPDSLNEHYRQYPRTESHAFRDESKDSLFNLTKIYTQVDYNDGLMLDREITTGSMHWKDGIKGSEVVFSPDKRGRFKLRWVPPPEMQNNVGRKGGLLLPGNEHIGAFGCDSYDISGTVDKSGSKGALHGYAGFHMDNAPTNQFFLEYVARPQTAELFFEDVLMAIHFFGMPILVENNKPRLLYHMKKRGYRKFSINRPDRSWNKMSVTEKELGGIPNSSEDVRMAHATAIETYIEQHVGYDTDGKYRDPDQIGDMIFNNTLHSWAKFDINNRTKYDASISSGLALMAVNKHRYSPQVAKKSSISLNLQTYNNSGLQSKINE